MTNNEAAKWIQLYIDLAKIDPTTGEAAYLNDDDKKTIEAMEMAVNALTAQPETHEERTETHACDCISRQWLMECVNEGWIKFDTEKDENRFIHLVRDIAPSAQPEPCKDAVKREDVQSIAEKSDWFESSDSFNDFMWALYELPSAQPDSKETSSTHKALDTISRQAAMEEISKQQTYKMFEGEDTLYLDANDVGSVLASLPSAQPEMIKEIRKWINSGNRGNADYFIVEKIEEIINKYE